MTLVLDGGWTEQMQLNTIAPSPVGEASRGLGVSKPTVSRHLKLLEEAGVVTRVVDGRVHRLGLRPETLADAAEWIVPGSFGCASTVFAATATFAPSCAARIAIARPMPRDPPVMKSVRSSSVRFTAIPHRTSAAAWRGTH